ncbi:2-hydroxyacid dehydrogenase [Halorarum salinum]|uniref:D-glycerate dehydrogenase n=1 Tax=Halorarum salinum TaxID=2743089 RepID=A0A7D5QAK3_9EURY|nr:D-glycerate dehydrogenase [Halobaculum salinum]QLG61060.1 D-glycerate dehydrogenase [Halobaculum salinum]
MTNKPTVYVTRRIPSAGLEQLERACTVEVWPEKTPPSKDHFVERLSALSADGLVCLLTDDVDAEVMDASPDLRVISTYSVGYDHVDLDAAAARDIAVGHTPGVLTDTTADFAWSLLATCARRTVEGQAYVRDGEWETWQPTLLTGQDIHGSTLGLVGLGNIGTGVAKRAAGFEMNVLYSDVERHERTEEELAAAGVDITYVDQDDVFERSDFVSLHVPLLESTRGLVGEAELRRMKDDAVLINTSRGPVVDTDALETALERDWIERAGLDVTDPEPLPADHSILEYAPEKLVVTPHLASASVQTRDKMAEMAAANALAGVRGEPLPNSALDDAS